MVSRARAARRRHARGETPVGARTLQPARRYRPAPVTLDIPAIRAQAGETAARTGRYGIRDARELLILQLCDLIDATLPWRAVEARNARRRQDRRERWQRRPSLIPVGLAWADEHRGLVLGSWGALPATIRGTDRADLWVIPRPGERVVLCPECGQDNERRARCSTCDHTGFVTKETP